ncbi:alpha/beta-hydrolase [Dendrothele bispora CBS 962.96]|uniref:Carboxylic ester hydrolase n=1 Tax=Dendrothele bispora (strain CBS 962.96) TaxID=1314807 RepID=A0A4S8M1L2_DENBC|nr:alpha/beta-hydrolase [Dendrothele bispora CBS 962.96]
MRFAKPIDLAFLLTALGVVSYSDWFAYGAPTGRSVSLLFENDGVWPRFGERPSALLFHEPLTSKEAAQVCKENNETLLSRESFSSFSDQLLYFQSTGAIAVSSDDQTLSSNTVADISNEHPFLCTNSAPHTVQVDTDFTSTPRTTVTSHGTSFTGTRDHLAFRFMGIPFAQPPVGDLRFQQPQKFTGNSDINATGFKPGCLQFGSFQNNDLGLNPWGIDEDCLYLNVYTPFIPSNSSGSSQLKPVFFWIYGGGNTGGTGTDATFDGGPLVSRGDVVVVTINYRLNIFGFLALNDGVVTGNYALGDKIMGLQWVKENIAAFGGDPNRVLIFGQSAGGWSIIDLLRSPKAAGLFHTAVIHSGGSSTFRTQEQAQAAVEPTISKLCDGTGEARLQCLQALPAETLLNLTTQLSSWPSVQDGVLVLEEAVAQVSRGPSAVNSVPVIAGFMPDEGQSLMGTTVSPNATDFNASLVAIGGPSLAQAVLDSGLWVVNNETDVYNATVSVDTDRTLTCAGVNFAHAAAQSNAFPAFYVYNMHHAYGLSFFNPFGLCTFPVGQPQPYYRCHSGDLYEIFGTYYIFDQPPRTETDFFFTNLLQDLWVSFARTGNPNPSLEYLKSRGPAYESTVKILEQTGFVWPTFEDDTQVLASLEYPELGVEEGLPDDRNGRCSVICANDCAFIR